MLYDFFSVNGLLHSSESFEIKETFDQLYIKASPEVPIASFILKLFDELKTLSARDSFELFLDISGDLVNISDTSPDSIRLLTDHIKNNADEETYEITLTVSKLVQDCAVSVYFIGEFSTYLNTSPLKDLFVTFSSFLKSKLLVEVFSTISSFSSNGILFYQSGQPVEHSDFLDSKSRSALLEMYSENANNTDVRLQILPSDFYLTTESKIFEINSFFKKACGMLSLIFMANTSNFKSKYELAYRVCGFKTIVCDSIHFADFEANSELLYKLMSWSYEGGSSADKIGLLRNVLSIHLDGDGNIKFDNEVWNTVRSNYQIYLKGNIQDYLDVKNKICEIIIDSTTKTHAIADDLLDVFKNNVFVMLTFILTVVVVNGVKDNGGENIFSNVYLAVVIILCLVSSAWLAMTALEAKNRFVAASATIREILSLNYKKIIMASEIDESVNPVIESNRKYLNNQIKRYALWWVAIALLFIISFSVANYFFGSPKSENSESDAKKERVVLVFRIAEEAQQQVEEAPKTEDTAKAEEGL